MYKKPSRILQETVMYLDVKHLERYVKGLENLQDASLVPYKILPTPIAQFPTTYFLELSQFLLMSSQILSMFPFSPSLTRETSTRV